MTFIPRFLFSVILIFFTCWYAIPKLLLKGRCILFSLIILIQSISLSAFSVGVEGLIKSSIDARLTPVNFTSPYIWAYIISNSGLLLVLMSGFGGIALYKKWSRQVEIERQLSRCNMEHITTLKSRFDIHELMENLDAIISDIETGNGDVESEIVIFSDSLRSQLYDEPVNVSVGIGDEEAGIADRRLTSLIISPRLRALRWLMLETLVLIISLGAIFPCSQLNFSFLDMTGVVLSFVILNVVVFFNKMIIFPILSGIRGNMKTYVLLSAFPLAAVGIAELVSNFVFYSHTHLPDVIMSVIAVGSSIGTVITVGLFWTGVDSFLCLQRWLLTERRIVFLRAESMRLELSVLQKQLNPHFLFNVLNNIEFLIEENPARAILMLKELKRLFEYQLKESLEESTDLASEVAFLKAYLSLERMRHDYVDFEIESSGDYRNITVPTLLFIPFVENAVKHSVDIGGCRRIVISVSVVGDEIRFCCRNSFDPLARLAGKRGGIGLENTRRRLNLLYGENFRLAQYIDGTEFVTILEIPLNHVKQVSRYEIYNN